MPYGGGMGMIMAADPIYSCYKSLYGENEPKPHLIYMSPKGKTFKQQRAAELARLDRIVLLCGFKYFYLDNKGAERLEALKVQPHGNVALIAFKGTDSIEKAEKLRGRIIYINRNDANLPSGRYFIEDLIGCAVFNADSGENYGVISEVSATGANDVWHISGGGREYLLPAIDEVVINADIENEKVFIRPMKGIFDDED